MRVYHDWEFLEDHGHVDVISAGFVREDGQELYIVFDDFNTLAVANNRWLMENVMPSIGHEEFTSHVTGLGTPVKDLYINDPARMSKRLARAKILDFVHDITPEWWAWHGAYDHVALCSIFGRMVDLPVDWPFITMDIKQLHKSAGNPELPKQPPGKHNALEDARHNVVRYDFLTKYVEEKQHERV